MAGSLALALKESFSNISISGYARSKESYLKLKKLRILDKIERDLSKVVKDADMVILAMPVGAIVDYLKPLSGLLKKGAIVLDLGSSKRLISNAAKKHLGKKAVFIGCHPLCGSEKSGPGSSCKDLYKDSICLITADATDPGIKVVKKLWQGVGSKVVFINPDFHDKVLSSVSHFPHVISFILTYLVPENYHRFASGSFKDLTRISGSSAYVWADIFLSNKDNLLKDAEAFIRALRGFTDTLKKGDRERIVKFIKKVNYKNSKISKL